MIHSMTAFARKVALTDNGQLTFELRSVNHRHSELGLRLPDEFRDLEPSIREMINACVKRGKIDASLRYQVASLSGTRLAIDRDLVIALTTAGREVSALMESAQPLTVSDVLRWPGVLQAPEPDLERLKIEAMALLQSALEELTATRRREGEQLGKLLFQRCTQVRSLVNQARKVLPDILPTLKQRIKDKLDDMMVKFDEGRLEQEIVLLANRADIAEEVDRLATHVDEIERVLRQDEPVGRRLDFLMQELNREANTLGSKAVNTTVSQIAVELKVLIEQMREQIQNIE